MRLSFVKKIAFVIFGLMVPFLSYAGSVELDPAKATRAVGDILNVDVVVKSTDKAINAVAISVAYPEDALQLVSYVKNRELVSFWIDDNLQRITNPLKFEGLLIDAAYQGGGEAVATLSFKVLRKGVHDVIIADGALHAADGNGTNVLDSFVHGRYLVVDESEVPVLEGGIQDYIVESDRSLGSDSRSGLGSGVDEVILSTRPMFGAGEGSVQSLNLLGITIPLRNGFAAVGLTSALALLLGLGALYARRTCYCLHHEVAVFGMGHFWKSEELFRRMHGVLKTEVGYMGGDERNPTFEMLEDEDRETEHVLVVRVTYNSGVIGFQDLLRVFWANHNPTQKDGQGKHKGRHYRSVIFYLNQLQFEIAEASRDALDNSAQYKRKIVTNIEPASKFWSAEEFHQKHLMKKNLI